ncbi:MAG TPA: hypothetical protein VLR69_15550, partial [Thermoanaerobaculia bacterium]|nr:hypothetical protein [Thermoanaerobaculia bacterium]
LRNAVPCFFVSKSIFEAVFRLLTLLGSFLSLVFGFSPCWRLFEGSEVAEQGEKQKRRVKNTSWGARGQISPPETFQGEDFNRYP